MHSSDLSLEPSVIKSLTAEQQQCLADVLDRYLSSLENGVPLDPEELIARHPDLGEPLRAYFRSLDNLHNVAAGFATPVTDPSGDELALGTVVSEPSAMRLGDYVLGRELGRGGMGVVYEARQISLDRRVALKVLPFAAVLDAKQIARFKNEAQAAAQLHHPNIVPVFAVGVERGVHYYAMQLIDGQPLDRAIAQLRKQVDGQWSMGNDSGLGSDSPAPDTHQLSAGRRSYLTDNSTTRRDYIRTIVRLGIEAAEALHAAHEYGIVHRDIKPSNLLLDGEGKLWVTDFGLARFGHDNSLTRSGDIIGTMRYMSPEQAAGESSLVDHRTDIYSLAVTLYELLTLQPAITGENGLSLLREIDLQEPPRLRRVRPEIPRDVETVIRKAMAKQPDERYSSARQFADDLQCILDGKPTAAKPPGLLERMSKWGRRHNRLVATATSICLLIVVGSVISTLLILRETVKADRNYRRAEKNFQTAREAVDHFGSQFAQRLSGIAGAEEVRRELLHETLVYYQDFIDQAKGDPALRADLALAYSKIAALTDELGSNDEAVVAHETALRLWRQLAADETDSMDDARKLALGCNNLALAYGRAGRVDDSRGAFHEAIKIQEQLIAKHPDSSCLRDLALSYSNLGLLQSETGGAVEAAESFRKSIALQQRLIDQKPDDPEQLRSIAAAHNNLGGLRLRDDPVEAIDIYRTGLNYQRQAVAARPTEVKFRGDLAVTYNNLASAHARNQDLAAAAQAYRQAIDIQEALVREAPAHKLRRRDLAVSLNNYALAVSRLGHKEEAEQLFRQALASHETLVAQFPDDVGLRSSMGGVYNNLGIVLEGLGRTAEAAEAYSQAIQHQRDAYVHAPKVDRYRAFLSKHYYNYGRVLRQLGKLDLAVQVALERRDLWPGEPQHLYAVAEDLALASRVLAEHPDGKTDRERCVARTLDTLQQAVTLGFDLPGNIATNDSFAAVREEQRFKDLIGH